VVGDGPGDDLVLPGFAGQLVELLGQFPRALHRFAAAGGEEHPVQIAGGVVRQPVGQFDCGWGGVGPQREEVQCLGLLGGGLGELLSAVADLNHEQSGQAVEIALAMAVVDVAALATGDDRRRDAVSVPGEVTPQVAVRLV
jgi:hypothetical protein